MTGCLAWPASEALAQQNYLVSDPLVIRNDYGYERLFARQVQFAELTTTRVTPDNAAYLHAMALRLLRFSPEPRVVEKIIDSALLLGLDDEARLYLDRLQAAYPEAHAAWLRARARP